MELLLKSIDDAVLEKNHALDLLETLRVSLTNAVPGIQEVLDRGYGVFGEGIARWMVTYSRHLGKTPAEVLLEGRVDDILTYLNQIDYGVYL